MPDTEFRAVYGGSTEGDGMALARSRNKLPYLWAYRVSNSAAPSAATTKMPALPIGMRASVPVRLDKAAAWRALGRAYDWSMLTEGANPQALKVPVRVDIDNHTLIFDLHKFTGSAGNDRVEAKRDWDTLKVAGSVRLYRLDEMKAARVTPASQEKLISGTGPVMPDVTGANLLFVEKASLHRPASSHQISVDLPSDRGGIADQLRVEVDTDPLRPGPYLLALSRTDGATADVSVRILPPLPKLTGRIRVNAGEGEQTVVFMGAGLDRIDGLESDRADIALKSATGESTRREATVIDGLAQAISLPIALQVAAACPRIREAKASPARDVAVSTREGALAAGSWASFALRLDPAGLPPSLALQCADPALGVQTSTLRPGENQAAEQWTSAGDAWVLSFDAGAFGQSGCALQAIVETEAPGKADAFSLGRVVRRRRIEAFVQTDEKPPEGLVASLRGFDLETIEKTRWNAQAGALALELPRPVPGEGAPQTLCVSMPWPSPTPKAPLYIWLRGRATKITPL